MIVIDITIALEKLRVSYGFWPSKYKHECYYPHMFSEVTLRCENYTSVDCGTRFKPTWECK